MTAVASLSSGTGFARISFCAALIAALGLPGGIVLFSTVPITAQTLGVMLAGAFLGPRRGAYAVVLFLMLVAVGFPFLSGGKGGLGVFVGPAVGYLIGWIAGAYVCGILLYTPKAFAFHTIRVAAAMLFGGIVTVYAFGIVGQAFVLGLSLEQAALLSLTYVPGDLLKVVLATLLVMRLARVYPRAFHIS